MYIGTNPCSIEKAESFSVHGETIFGDPIPELVNIIHYGRESRETSVRADTSASRGHQDLQRSRTRLMADPNTAMRYGDKVYLNDYPEEEFKVVELRKRFDGFGVIDHYEVDLETWS